MMQLRVMTGSHVSWPIYPAANMGETRIYASSKELHLQMHDTNLGLNLECQKVLYSTLALIQSMAPAKAVVTLPSTGCSSPTPSLIVTPSRHTVHSSAYPKVIMDFATNAFDRTVVAIHLVQPGVKSIIYLGEHVTGHEVVNVKANSVLFLFNSFVCDGGVVRVKDVQFGFEVATEFSVPK